MNRADWIKEKRREAEENYDTLWAPLYGETFGLYDNATHQQFIQKFLSLLTEPASILDAACGAGRYMPMLLEKATRCLESINQKECYLALEKNFLLSNWKRLVCRSLPFTSNLIAPSVWMQWNISSRKIGCLF